jgi:hypothetical protein
MECKMKRSLFGSWLQLVIFPFLYRAQRFDSLSEHYRNVLFRLYKYIKGSVFGYASIVEKVAIEM